MWSPTRWIPWPCTLDWACHRDDWGSVGLAVGVGGVQHEANRGSGEQMRGRRLNRTAQGLLEQQEVQSCHMELGRGGAEPNPGMWRWAVMNQGLILEFRAQCGPQSQTFEHHCFSRFYLKTSEQHRYIKSLDSDPMTTCRSPSLSIVWGTNTL